MPCCATVAPLRPPIDMSKQSDSLKVLNLIKSKDDRLEDVVHGHKMTRVSNLSWRTHNSHKVS